MITLNIPSPRKKKAKKPPAKELWTRASHSDRMLVTGRIVRAQQENLRPKPHLECCRKITLYIHEENVFILIRRKHLLRVANAIK